MSNRSNSLHQTLDRKSNTHLSNSLQSTQAQMSWEFACKENNSPQEWRLQICSKRIIIILLQ